MKAIINTSEIRNETNGLVQQLMKSSYQNGTEITGEHLLNESMAEIDWLVKGLIQRQGSGALAGPSDVLKSTTLRQFAIAITTGEDEWLGFPLNSIHNSAIIVCTEDDRASISYLLKRQTPGKRPSELNSLRFMFDPENLLEELEISLSNKPADIVIIDCFADVFGGDLKDTQKIRTFLTGYQRLSVKHNCFILFLHHTGKRTEDLAPSKNNLLSGQGFEAKMRLVMELRTDPFHLDHRHLCIVKGNYLPRSMKTESFVLRFDEETFLLTNTGERTPFELLVKLNEDGSKVKYEQAKELKDKGYSYEKIAQMIGYQSKGSVSKLFDKAEKNKWGVS